MKQYILLFLLACSTAFVGCEEEIPQLSVGEQNAQILADIAKEKNIKYVSIYHRAVIGDGDTATQTYVNREPFTISNSFIVVNDYYYDLNRVLFFEIRLQSNGETDLKIWIN